MADLRERKKQATRTRIAEEALRMFVADGYAATTTERVAAAADVSPRTVNRYFPAKSDLVFHYLDTWMKIFETEAASGPKDEEMQAKLRRVSHRIVDSIEADPIQIITAIGIASRTPELREREVASNAKWIDLVTATITSDAVEPFAARVVGAAAMGMISTVVGEWVRIYPKADMHELLDKGFDLLGAGLDAYFADGS